MRSDKRRKQRGEAAAAAIVLTLAVLSGSAVKKMRRMKDERARQKAERDDGLILLLNRWIQAKQEGKRLDEYLCEKGYQTVAIYGMSDVGERVYQELRDSRVRVSYGIDRNYAAIYSNLRVYSPEDDLKGVDAVIVTAVYSYDEICMRLRKKMDCPILSLEEILFDL